MSTTAPDPYAAYGGQQSSAGGDPYASYGGKVTAPAPTPPEGFWHSLAAQFGMTPEAVQAAAADDAAHPVKAAINLALGPGWSLVKGVAGQVQQSAAQIGQAYRAAQQGNGYGVAQHLITAVPIVGPALDKGADQYASGDYLGEAGTLTGAAAQAAPLVAGGMDAAGVKIPGAQAASNAASAAKMKLRPSSSPAIVSPETIQAQKIAQAILPPGGIKPDMVSAIQAEAPAVVEYAQRTGNPLNTQAEGLVGAQGVAQEGLAHFNDNILGPVAQDSVTLGTGRTDLGSSATLGQISDEISSLNNQVNTAKAANAGDALATMAKKGGVMDQLQYLRGVLYDNLATKTGIAPDQLQALREGYGGQFTMADALESAQNARLTRTGKASQGVNPIGAVPTSLADIPGKAWTLFRGGEQAIADRQFSSAMKDVQPQAPSRPMPNPPGPAAPAVRTPIRGGSTPVQTFDTTPQPSLTEANVAARNSAKSWQADFNKAQAQQEFLHSTALDQAAQDAASQRNGFAQGVRDLNTQVQKAVSMGQKGPDIWATVGKAKIAQHLQQSASGLTTQDLATLGNTAAGKQLLINASDLTPGSKAMTNLVQQIKSTIGASQ